MPRAEPCRIVGGKKQGRARPSGAALAFVALLGLATALAAAPLANAAGTDTTLPPSPPPVAENSSSTASGSAMAPRVLVEPLHHVTLSSAIQGRIERLPFRSGDTFRRGQVLVRFDCTIYRAQQQAAQAVVDQAQDKLGNDQQLVKLNSIGNLDVALDQAALEKAQAELRIAKAHVDGCIVRAPYNGRVIARKVHEHETVAAGKPLLQILDDTGFTLDVIIPSSWLSWVHPGTPFILHVDDTGRDYHARVSVLGAQVDPVSQSIKVRGKIEGSTAGLIAGMGGAADFSASMPHTRSKHSDE